MTRWYLLPALLLFFQCSANKRHTTDFQSVVFKDKPKNIVLIIGDGMATAQVTAGLYWKGNGKSVFEQFRVVGFHKSHSCNDLVTDSAAGATAFACGEKTNNGSIAVLPPDNQPCPTILEMLDAQGWATGMVVTCSATHATPASFIAHEDIRAFTENIAFDYLSTPIDCFIGGGEAYFNQRPDKINLIDSLKQRGYVVKRGNTFNRLPLDGSAPFMLFTAEREPPTALASRSYLPPATKVACEFLDKRSDKGFFLMVEGSQIDWAGHANDRNWLRAEMLDFDDVVRNALEFAAKDTETLVIVTGDHECGGLTLEKSKEEGQFNARFAYRLHTGALVPVFAYGPRAALFSGIYDNTAIYGKMLEALGARL